MQSLSPVVFLLVFGSEQKISIVLLKIVSFKLLTLIFVFVTTLSTKTKKTKKQARLFCNQNRGFDYHLQISFERIRIAGYGNLAQLRGRVVSREKKVCN